MTTPDYTNNYLIDDVASKFGMSVNKERASVILKKLEENELERGAPYCPCWPQRNVDTICPCKYMRQQQDCRCKLYVKREEM